MNIMAIAATLPESTAETKKELNNRVKRYQSGGKTVSAQAMKKRIDAIRAKRK